MKYCQGKAVVKHLAHLVDVERVVPPHEVRLEHGVDSFWVKECLVGCEEEVVSAPAARLALGLNNAASGAHVGRCW